MISLRISRMCRGVVPQHPPTMRTPDWIMRLAYLAMYFGVVW